ncbi:unnamed protein product [Symbiodinium natans]|uniref:Uncharacterized protein n=1 Tax=Symbiodinium natans TaxID=878477 RepID=A0A812MRA1_9DINO|nr:unnamed protein product [Symbiodinium natans]
MSDDSSTSLDDLNLDDSSESDLDDPNQPVATEQALPLALRPLPLPLPLQAESLEALEARVMQYAIECMTEMAVIEPGLMRVVSARTGVRVLARVACCKRRQRQSHGRSFVAAEIGQFWSHSWHGSPWNKLFLLLAMQKGLNAILCGTLAGLVAMALFVAGILPGVPWPSLLGEDRSVLLSFWSTAAGLLAALPTLAFSKGNGSVFLDCICVDQQGKAKKAECIMSLGGFLKKSKTLISMWDTTYCQRLWCLFELAAFLKSHGDSAEALVVRPTVLGACTCALACGMSATMVITFFIRWNDLVLAALVFMGWGFLGFTAAVAALRHYYESIREMQEQMRNFQIDQAKCWCCEKGHQGPNGSVLSCDRKILTDCFRLWFGSIEDFEIRVRSSISGALASQLGRQAFPYHWLLGCTSPMLWCEMDLFASRYYEDSLRHLPNLFGWWLGGFPLLVYWVMFLSERCCQPAKSRWLNALQTISIALLVCPAYLALFAYQLLLSWMWPGRIPGAVLFAATTFLVAQILWHPWYFKRLLWTMFQQP